MAHIGVTCDGCGLSNFFGNRFKCIVCFDYDLCNTCASNGITSKEHQESHPMQPIPSPGSEPESLFGSRLRDGGGFRGLKSMRRAQEFSFSPGESPKPLHDCPVCGKGKLSEGQFFDHMIENHRNERFIATCPLCKAAPQAHQTYRKGGLIDHLQLRHRRVSEKLQKHRVLRRLIRHAGGNIGSYADVLSSLNEDQASELLQRIEAGENITEVFASAKAEVKAVEKHNPDSLLRPIIPSTNGEEVERDVERTKKSVFVQELLLSTIV